MKNLTPIKSIVNSAFNELTGDTHNYNKRLLITLCRIKKFYIPSLKNFVFYLEKLIEYDREISFYSNLYSYLSDFYIDTPWAKISSFLEKHNYSKDIIKNFSLNQEEKKLLAKIPSYKKFLAITIFFLYDPTTVQKFFIENFTISLSKSERECIQNLQLLDPDLQHRVSHYIKNLLRQQNGEPAEYRRLH